MPINFNLVSIYLLLPLLAISITLHRVRMRDRMERLVILPFSLGCVSQESVAVATTQPRKPKSEPNPFVRLGSQEREESSEVKMMKSDFMAAPKPNISNGIQRLVKTFKSISHQLFVDKEEMEMEIEIGFPTDVKHVGHIGWDEGSPTTEVRGYYCTENLITAAAVEGEEIEEEKNAAIAPNDQILSFPSINYSLRQFELPCNGCPA